MNHFRASALSLSALLFAAPAIAQQSGDLLAQRAPAAEVANNRAAGHWFDDEDSWGLIGLPVRGPEDALVTIVEFSDFQCPFCARAAPVVERVQEQFPDDVRVVFVQMPLNFHENAHIAAQASLAAHAQGAFWEYHDVLFENLHLLGEQDLVRHAEALNLDADAIARALRDGTYSDEVDRQFQLASDIGVRGTPNFFVNGQNIRGAQPFDVFRVAVEEELAAAEALLEEGHSRPEVYRMRRDANLFAAVADAVPVPTPARPPEPPTFVAAELPSNPVFRGPDDALVTIIEFTDYQCPYCSRANGTMDDLLDANDDVRIVIRHNPLAFHRRADEAAAAAIAAGEQGMFWEYHDLLFGSGSTFEDAELEGFAAELGLDMTQWHSDRVSQSTLDAIAADQAAASAVGASGTPQFFVNGERVRGAQPLDAFQNAVDAARIRAQDALDAGADIDSLYETLMENIDDVEVAQAEEAEEAPVVRLDTSSAPFLGDPDAPIELVVFTDFECPFCVRFAETAVEFAVQNDDVRLAVMHFPLAFHGNAHVAAQAAVEAAEQGLFWEFYEVLHDNGTTVDRTSLENYAGQVGMNVEELRAALDSEEHVSAVDADMSIGQSAGVRGTPSWFVNGVFHSGAHPLAYVESVVETARSALDD